MSHIRLTAVSGAGAILFSSAILSACLPLGRAMRPEDGLSSFFLKASKSVPRVGRSFREGHVESFFLKPPKSIPRMGKKDEDNMDAATGDRLFTEQLNPAVLRRRFIVNDDYDSSWRPQDDDNPWNYQSKSPSNDNPDEFGYNFDSDQYSRQKRDVNKIKYGGFDRFLNLERAVPDYQQTTK